MVSFQIDTIRTKAEAGLVCRGVESDMAAELVDHMLTADLRGRSTHGLATRYRQTAKQAEAGRGQRSMEVAWDTGSLVKVNGNNGFGYYQGSRCVSMLTARVAKHGLCSVALRNTGHTGMLGYYADHAAREGVVTMAFSHCCPLMAPYGGSQALLGTNPLAIGMPADPNPVLVDLGTAAATFGQCRQYTQENKRLPEGVALDGAGKPTTDPGKAQQGCLLPFDGARGGALAVAVQLLAGAFTGSPAVPPRGEGYGLLLIGFSKGVFAGESAYEDAVETFVEQYRNIPAREGYEVRLPGSRGYAHERKLRTQGIMPIPEDLAGMLHLR